MSVGIGLTFVWISILLIARFRGLVTLLVSNSAVSVANAALNGWWQSGYAHYVVACVENANYFGSLKVGNVRSLMVAR